MTKKHVRSNIGGIVPMCGVAITDAKLQFIDDKFRGDGFTLGQASTCQRCAKIAIKELYNG